MYTCCFLDRYRCCYSKRDKNQGRKQNIGSYRRYTKKNGHRGQPGKVDIVKTSSSSIIQCDLAHPPSPG